MPMFGRLLLATCIVLLSQPVSAQEIYHYTPKSTFILRGDTVWWVRPFPTGDSIRVRMEAKSKPTAPTGVRMDTIIYLLLRDSVVLLKPRRETLPPAIAKHFRNIIVEA